MKLLQNQIKQADFARTVWSIQPEPGSQLEELLIPEAWVHVAKQFRAGDHIDVIPIENDWYAELLVRAVTPLSISVVLLRHVRFEGATKSKQADVAQYDVRHRGGAGWSVIRLSDKEVMYERGDTKEQAEAWVKANALG